MYFQPVFDTIRIEKCFASTEHARMATKNAIKTYNEKRLHLSLGYKTPESVFEYQVNLNVKPVAVY
jgi:transposase InsO family protein